MGWLTGWNYRKGVTVSRPSGAVTDYQMLMKIYYGSGTDGTESVDGLTAAKMYCGNKCKTDFGDIRITKADGSSVLNYWIEVNVASNYAILWVKLDSIGTSATTFYVYYGNSSTASLSSGADTFIFFDNFERGNDGDPLGGSWLSVGNAKISTDHAFGGTRSGKIPYNGTNPYISQNANSEEKAVRFRAWKEDATTDMYVMWGLTGYQCRFYANQTEDIYYLDYGGTPHDTGYNIVADAWGSWEIFGINLTNHTYCVRFNGTQIMTNVQMNGASFGAFGFYNPSTTSTHDFYIDNVIVRNYRATEPAWGSWGEEEQEPYYGLFPYFLSDPTVVIGGTRYLLSDPTVQAQVFRYLQSSPEVVKGGGRYLLSSPGLIYGGGRYIVSTVTMVPRIPKPITGARFQRISSVKKEVS